MTILNSSSLTIGFARIPSSIAQEPLLPSLLLSLTEPQRQRASKMKPRRQQQYVLGRWVLHNLAETLCSADVAIKENEQLPPSLSTRDRSLYCSISHCQLGETHIAAAAIHHAPVGLDIEVIRTNWSAEKAELFCTNAELEAAEKVPEGRQRDFFYTQCWSRKEAFSKAHQRSVWHTGTLSANLLEHPWMHDFSVPDSGVVGAVCADIATSIEERDLDLKLA